MHHSKQRILRDKIAENAPSRQFGHPEKESCPIHALNELINVVACLGVWLKLEGAKVARRTLIESGPNFFIGLSRLEPEAGNFGGS